MRLLRTCAATVTNWFHRGAIIERQRDIIDILQRRATIIDARSDGRQIVLTFARGEKTVKCSFYNAGIDVQAMREKLGL